MGQHNYDIVIIGAGIVGLATALAVTAGRPELRLAVIDKEASPGTHQTGHNSGVIHSGIYYRPGSLKARLCVDGARRLVQYCEAHSLPLEKCGKIVIATHEHELPALHELYRRGQENGVPGLRMLDAAGLKECEPHAAGLAALHSPGTAIVDYGAVARAMADDLRRRGARVLTCWKLERVVEDGRHLRLLGGTPELSTRFIVNCAGLHADTVAERITGERSRLQIVPFRGEYYLLIPEKHALVRGLIYPVPDPAFPFLGVHLTRTVHGQVEGGPNAVLALSREGYARWSLNGLDLTRMLAYPGFWRMAARYWRTGTAELARSFSKDSFARSLRRLLPDLAPADLVPGPSGVRAQAVDSNGRLIDDFVIESSPRAVHILNAPSPAATASLAIGDHVAAVVAQAMASA